MLLSGKVLHTSNSTHLFWNLETLVCTIYFKNCIESRKNLKYLPIITDWLFLKAHFSVRYWT